MDQNQRIYLSIRDDLGSDNGFAEGRWSRKHPAFMGEDRLRRLFLVRAQSSLEGNVYGVSGKPLVQQFNTDIMEGKKSLRSSKHPCYLRQGRKNLCYFKQLHVLAKFCTGSLPIYILNKKEGHASLFLADRGLFSKFKSDPRGR